MDSKFNTIISYKFTIQRFYIHLKTIYINFNKSLLCYNNPNLIEK